jgi:hypothetical protein
LGVGRWAFLFCYWHEFHSALWTISRLIGYYLGMHRAGVIPHLLMLMLLLLPGLMLVV